MRRIPRLLPRLLLVASLAFVLGCAGCCGCGGGGGPGTAAPPDTRTPGEYFRERQATTMTPNGRIVTDTVTERDGRIEYATEDGRRWRVGYSRRADGTYQYGTPDEGRP